MTTYHPIWDRLDLTGGELVTLRYITKDGTEKVLQGKVKGFVHDGQTIALETVDPHTRETKLRGISGDSAQRYVDRQDAEAAAERLANTPKATAKQVEYAFDLIHDRLGQIAWANTDHGQGWTMPDRERLAAMTKLQISALIDEMREELGYDNL